MIEWLLVWQFLMWKWNESQKFDDVKPKSEMLESGRRKSRNYVNTNPVGKSAGHHGGSPMVGHHMKTGGGKWGFLAAEAPKKAPRPGPDPKGGSDRGILRLASFSSANFELSECSDEPSSFSSGDGDSPRPTDLSSNRKFNTFNLHLSNRFSLELDFLSSVSATFSVSESLSRVFSSSFPVNSPFSRLSFIIVFFPSSSSSSIVFTHNLSFDSLSKRLVFFDIFNFTTFEFNLQTEQK